MQGLSVRPATPADATAIIEMLQALARFERAPGAVRLTEQTLVDDAFGETPRFHVFLAETADGIPCGVATAILAYSSWSARPVLTLHDLFVRPQARRTGAGRAILAAVTAFANARDCCRIDVNVLSWNGDAERFYRSQGFQPLEEWRPFRLDLEGPTPPENPSNRDPG